MLLINYIPDMLITENRKLSVESTISRSPWLSHDGNHLIWLERTISQARNNVKRLMHLKWNTLGLPAVLIDAVQDTMIISENKKFYKLYNLRLPKRRFAGARIQNTFSSVHLKAQ
ncbi:hypothetical protein TSAR_011952 [Trichomalopsis sarcophagae]|uniref:Uncharacterized protein n=1 Tax=Trichomalopsis sarcophagae TaxID=543379 RepID=A0A232F6A8_9HYME|nr:hypothetical protein TSAR_011952 [Trichomalopsis sarcophagae]